MPSSTAEEHSWRTQRCCAAACRLAAGAQDLLGCGGCHAAVADGRENFGALATHERLVCMVRAQGLHAACRELLCAVG